MSYEYVIDACAGIEYFRASRSGEVAKRHVESEESAPPTIVVSAISRELLREAHLGNEPRGEGLGRLEFIAVAAQIAGPKYEIAVKACEIDLEMKEKRTGWRQADSMVLSTARAAEKALSQATGTS